ncbi:MAG TPA: inositol monophosphatase family protein [Gammaproteobacteria bacterium]
MTHSVDDDLALALRLADVARTISLARFRGELRSWRKADGSLVTEVDEAVEDAVRAALGSERPGDAMLGEERGQTGSGPRRWIVDAIDGTQSFASGTTQWATLIALETDGEVVLGVCDHPPLGRRYWAAKGRGAFMADGGAAPVRLRVSATASLDDACTFIPPPEWVRDAHAREVAAALGRAARPERVDDHPAMLVARGDCDLAVFFVCGPWDVAAPSIVVREAGGAFSDLAGNPSLGGTALFSNGVLHAAALRITAPRT